MKKFFFYILFVANLAIITFLWLATSGNTLLTNPTIDIVYIVFSRIAGLLAVYFTLLQFLIIGRVKWLERTFGFDKLSTAHYWIGVIAFTFIVLHLLLLLAGYSLIYKATWWQQFVDFNTSWEELFPATVSVFLFIVVIISSISITKKMLKYELWYYVHLISYLAVLLAFGHQLEIGYDLRTNSIFSTYWILLYVFVIINFIFYRFLWQFYIFYKHKFYISKVQKETVDTVSIYIKGTNIQNFIYKPGQFVILRFLTTNLIFQAHPYSISSLPNSKYIRITIKSLGDFSSKIKNIAIGTKVLIDGPNGIFTKKENQGNKILFIAGGIGITPIRTLIEELLTEKKNIVLLYAVKSQNEIIFKKELELIEQKNKDNFKIKYIIKDKENADFNTIDENCIKILVPDVATREVYLCGPILMSKTMKKYLINLKTNKNKIYYEKFSF